jgi:hypothetical protein
MRSKTSKLLEENVGEALQGTGIDKDFLDRTLPPPLKAQKATKAETAK